MAWVALGVSQLVAGIGRPQGSPVTAVGSAAIDRTPPPVKNFAISAFGSHDKTVLIVGILVVLAVFSAIIGVAAMRSLRYGYIGLAIFAVIGLAAALTRPDASPWDVLPTVIGALAGAYALGLLAAGRLIGCFGLTEPTAGSDPGGMTTYARRDGSDWLLSGEKRWIGLASIADVAVIWAQTDDGIRGFVVPTATPGFTTTLIEPKLSMRASIQCDIALDDVRVPADAVLPNVVGLKGPFACLNEARYGIIWGAIGAARDSYETALRYSLQRLQFDQPLAAYQLTQRKLVDMVLEIQKGALVALHTGRLKDAGTLSPQQISFGKLNNVREAIAICREARTILGGNGITLDYSPLRHANNLESVRTYEGTDEVHMLIMGQAITGLPAFRQR